jgi:hypothetical protein
MAVYDDDIDPPDLPYPDDEIYDPGANGDAVRVRCPGTNLRNLFFFYSNPTRCPKIHSSAIIHIRQHSCSISYKAPWTIPSDYYKAYQACNSNPLLSDVEDVQIGYTKSVPAACKVTELYEPNTNPTGRLCTTRLRYVNLKTALFPSQCKWHKFAPAEYKVFKPCRRVHSTSDNYKPIEGPKTIRVRHQCNYYFPADYTTRVICHPYGKTTEIYQVEYTHNLGKCRFTEIINYSDYRLYQLCGSRILNTENIPNTVGVSAPHSFIAACRNYPLYVPIFDGYRGVCGQKKYITKMSFGYNSYICRLQTKYAPQSFLGHRVRCGHANRALVPQLIFGRVWGGRDPIIFVPRSSGRMMGKIRDGSE